MNERPLEEVMKEDIQHMRTLFDKYDKCSVGQKQTCANLLDQIILNAYRCDVAKENVVFPLIQKYVPDGDKLVKDLKDKSKQCIDSLKELEKVKNKPQELNARFTKLKEEFDTNVNRFEKEIIPKFNNIPQQERIQAGKLMENRHWIGQDIQKQCQHGQQGIYGQQGYQQGYQLGQQFGQQQGQQFEQKGIQGQQSTNMYGVGHHLYGTQWQPNQQNLSGINKVKSIDELLNVPPQNYANLFKNVPEYSKEYQKNYGTQQQFGTNIGQKQSTM
jgi:hypothetical protein